MINLGKAFEFYMLYENKDWHGLIKLVCESLVGGTKGDALYAEVLPIVGKYL